jgi:hypothetical protein
MNRQALGARVLALVAAAAVIVGPVAPAGAATTTTRLYPGPRVSDLAPVVPGPVQVTAVLFAGDDPAPGQTLTLRIRTYGATTFADAGHAVTGADGVASLTVRLDRSATAQWTYAGDADLGPSSSMAYPVEVSPRVGIRVGDRTLHKGQRLVVRGRTIPAKAGCTVRLWRGELRPLVLGPKPVRLDKARVRSDGTYKLVHRFHHKARMKVAVTVAPCDGNARGLSSYRKIWVR